MLRQLAATCVLVAAACVIAAPAPRPAPAPAPLAAGDSGAPFTIDPVHSTLLYRIRHFGVSNFYGRINMPTGSFRIDDADLGSSFVNVTAGIKNMDAGNDTRNALLASPDFFNLREYPSATFESSSISRTGTGTYEATGAFTMRGVKKRLTVEIEEYTTAQTTKFGFRGGFECTFTVKRSDFGMDMFVSEGTLGDEVRITAAIEGVQR